ncbi:NADH-quinone oxidoreductase subunit H [Streptomyces sp. C11-1]|uniref:NADH-quinone oxidoreductase subunit H n=1 Tax=Streptomyces durocortorensis TaxID=2811104 RepID=A0ABY9W1R0_9ACTN|nr:NADH-quinone oxidoreductase subunit H [Streptomyces durocortorensis]WNF30087.1 NADH-quinone oxidoreductase subunit H [Streptomyces durocortorensis]
MVESAPLWAALVLPLALALAAWVTATVDAGSTSAGREVLRLLVKQRRITRAADVPLVRLGTALLPVAAVLAAVVLPFGFRSLSDLPDGIVWFNAMEALAWAAVWLTGWGPNSTLSLVGGYRFLAQGLAYELPHMLAITTAALGAESLRVGSVVDAQAGLWFAVWMPAAFGIYLLSALAMAFWGPFDQPVGADAAGGAAAELSGVDRLLFLGGRWLLIVVAAAFAVPLFLGGGHGPLLPGWAWTVVKTVAVLAFLLWVRRRVPTVRMERYVELAWVVLTPLAVAQALVVAVVVLGR